MASRRTRNSCSGSPGRRLTLDRRPWSDGRECAVGHQLLDLESGRQGARWLVRVQRRQRRRLRIGSAGSRTFNCPSTLQLGPPPVATTCLLGVIFVPTALGTRTATLRFTTNDPVNPIVDVALSGFGTPAVVTPPPPIASAANFTDTWGNASEPHGVSASRITSPPPMCWWPSGTPYDVDGRAIWLELKDGHWIDA